MRARGFKLLLICAMGAFYPVPDAASNPALSEPIRSEKAVFRVETIATGLQNPWGLVELPDKRLLVTERPGRIRLIENGRLHEKPIEGVPPVFARGQGGLLDIELHPEHATNGWIYLAYSEPAGGGGHTVLARGKLHGHAWTEHEVIFRPPADQYTGSPVHFGCRIEFRDGYLFFGIGDRGAMDEAQNLARAQGKIHRLHDDGRIPSDNPVWDGKKALPSIWATGVRNPQGLRFHPQTGDLWESEHGPRGGDELNIIHKGANYGWPVITYGIHYNGKPITDKTEMPGMEQPVLHWTPSIAVGSIDFYHGDRFPGWKGNLLVTALAHQKLVRCEIDGQKVVHQEMLLQRSGRIRDLRILSDGLVYLVYDDPGQIVRLVPSGS
jgi:glucose/arabinose dehydrogenase